MCNKIDKIHYNSLQKVLQLKSLLKCLEISCLYGDNLENHEIMLLVEILREKAAEVENIIDELSII